MAPPSEQEIASMVSSNGRRLDCHRISCPCQRLSERARFSINRAGHKKGMAVASVIRCDWSTRYTTPNHPTSDPNFLSFGVWNFRFFFWRIASYSWKEESPHPNTYYAIPPNAVRYAVNKSLALPTAQHPKKWPCSYSLSDGHNHDHPLPIIPPPIIGEGETGVARGDQRREQETRPQCLITKILLPVFL